MQVFLVAHCLLVPLLLTCRRLRLSGGRGLVALPPLAFTYMNGRMSISGKLAAALITLSTAITATLAVTATPAAAAATPGIDVSRYQGTINWTSVRNAGIQFAYIKATEG